MEVGVWPAEAWKYLIYCWNQLDLVFLSTNMSMEVPEQKFDSAFLALLWLLLRKFTSRPWPWHTHRKVRDFGVVQNLVYSRFRKPWHQVFFFFFEPRLCQIRSRGSFLFWLAAINVRLSSSSDLPLSMVFRHISAIWLLDHGYIDDEVCEILGISHLSLYWWQTNQEVLGNVIPSRNPLQGFPCILDAEQANNLFSMLSDAPEMYLDKICNRTGLL